MKKINNICGILDVLILFYYFYKTKNSLVHAILWTIIAFICCLIGVKCLLRLLKYINNNFLFKKHYD